MKKNFQTSFVIFLISFIFASCSWYNQTIYKNKRVVSANSNGHTPCYISPKQDTSIIRRTMNSYLTAFDFRKNDTVASIGVGGGWREFLYSVFTDGITFYMEDMDTSCITREKINNIYIPHYSEIRGSKLTNNFIPASGSDSSINIKDNAVCKVIIVNVYHHFTKDKAMIKECRRILKPEGNLIIGEFVFRKNKHSYRYCPIDGGMYKSEKNFVNDIINIGFKTDTVYRQRMYRIFVFSKAK